MQRGFWKSVNHKKKIYKEAISNVMLQLLYFKIKMFNSTQKEITKFERLETDWF